MTTTTPSSPVLTALAPVLAEPGPFATVYLDASRDTASAAKEIELRWQSHRRELADAGADDATLDVMQEAVLGRTLVGSAGQVVVGAGGRVVLDEVLPQPPRRASAHWGPLPHLMPYVAQRPARPSYVLAVADRTGAEVLGFGPTHDGLDDPALQVTVEGDDSLVHKAGGGGADQRFQSGGGWAHHRLQNSVEDVWEKNAAPVAGTVDRLVEALEADLVLIAGDVKARRLVREALGTRARDLAVEIEAGGLRPGESLEALERAVEEQVDEVEAAADADVIEEFVEERGQDDRAVEGLADTVEALRRAQVETLVLVDDPSADGTLWVGPEPVQLGTSPDDLAALGVGEPVADRADAALLRAAVGTGAGVLVASQGQVDVRDGVGAVLRYADRT